MSDPGRRPFSEVRNFGRRDVDWPALPEHYELSEVAAHYLRHRIALEVRERPIAARRLAELLGDSERTWQARLTGERNLGLNDLVSLSLLIPGLVDQVIPDDDIDSWLPATYAGLAEGRIGGPDIPRFRAPGEVDWGHVADAMAEWWTTAAGDGTSWAIDASVLTHETLRMLDQAGLPRILAAPELEHTDGPHQDSRTNGHRNAYGSPPTGCSVTTVSWPLRDLLLSVVWLAPWTSATATRVDELLSWSADLLWSESPAAIESSCLAIAAPSPVAASIREVLNNSNGGTLSIKEAGLLRHKDPASVGDLQAEEVGSGGPIVWIRRKR